MMEDTSITIIIRLDYVPQAPKQGKRVTIPLTYQGQQVIADLNAKTLRKLNKQADEFKNPAFCFIEGELGWDADGRVYLEQCHCKVFEKKIRASAPGSQPVRKQPKPDSLARPKPPVKKAKKNQRDLTVQIQAGTYPLPPNMLDGEKYRRTKEQRSAEPFVEPGASKVGSEPFSVG